MGYVFVLRQELHRLKHGEAGSGAAAGFLGMTSIGSSSGAGGGDRPRSQVTGMGSVTIPSADGTVPPKGKIDQERLL